MYNNEPIPRPAGPPASSTPLRDYLNGARHGVDPGYAVLPRSLAESMPLPWQQQMAHLMAEFHQAFGHLRWPVYKVVPSRYERLVDLDEDQLAEVGVFAEIDVTGDLVYRERTGERIDDPENKRVLVSCLDPIPRQQAGHVPPAPNPLPPMPQNSGMHTGPHPVQQPPRHVQPPNGQQPPPGTPPHGQPMPPWSAGR
ncbi:hypothetical protein [Allokutzneria albata]|uniref:Uncharacterized protein n=1 Tax=Allokutzneria albata TaxID=211114 RepID=A0A1H0CJD3_ALLAB|nr:hypothetical protein [Allokutzneria albata]SDN57986.1 hypothetical protein SAMN04489726_7261 [Allokutzneria albata]